VRSRLSPALLALGLAAWVASARAEEPEARERKERSDAARGSGATDETARRLLQQAEQQFADGAIAEAETSLQAATRAASEPGLQARIELQLGLVYATQGRSSRARGAFRRALRHDPTISLDPHRYRPDFVQLFQRVRRRTVGEVEITSRGEVWVDGKPLGQAPCRRSLVAGRHWVELRDVSGQRDGRSVVVRPGVLKKISLAGAGPAPSSRPATRPVVGPASQPAPGPPARGRRLWTWLAAAGAVAAGGAALALGLAARRDYDEACDLLAGSGPCIERTTLADPADHERYLALGEAMDRKSLAANICWGVAGGLAVAAAVLFFVEGRSAGARETAASRSSSSAATVLVGPTGASLRLRY